MRSDLTNLVKRKIWQYNRRARDHEFLGDTLLLDNKKTVRVIPQNFPAPENKYDYLAVVFDYGDHHKIRFTTPEKYRKGGYLKSFLYRK